MRGLLAAVLLLAACASEPKVDYVALAYEAADTLVDGAGPALSAGGPVVYGVFTPVGHPDTSSEFGRIFAEHVSSRFAQKGIAVVELRLREAIAMRQGGPYALSDNVRDVARRVQARAALTGTYAVTDGFVLISLRLIDVVSGVVLSSWDRRIAIGCNDYPLLADEQHPMSGYPAACRYRPFSLLPWPF